MSVLQYSIDEHKEMLTLLNEIKILYCTGPYFKEGQKVTGKLNRVIEILEGKKNEYECTSN